jgi:type I restriction enzyme S subunit
MAGDWFATTFDTLVREHALEIGDGYRAKNDELGGDGLIFLRAGHVTDRRIDFSGVERFFTELEPRLLSKLAKPGDAVVTTKGNSTGRTAFVKPSMPPFVYSPHLSYWRSKDRDRVDGGFLHYWSKGAEFTEQLAGMKASTDMAPYLSLVDQKRLKITLPPVSEQRAIAHILGTLDDKIELNRRMSETLEAMARALFKSWFVDFDPVRAKMEGRWQRGQSLPGLPARLYDLFPDRLVDSELGEIPEGWEAASVDDEFGLTMGQSPPGDTYNESGDGLPFYQGRADFQARFPKRRVYCTAPTRFAKRHDTLISVRAPVGDINMAAEDCAIGRGVAAARHKSGSRSYTYQFMRSLEDVFAQFEAEGTVFGSISKKDFHNIACVAPPSPIITAFEDSIAPFDSRIDVLTRESVTLTALRDTLLPMLISGELRVSGRIAERALS